MGGDQGRGTTFLVESKSLQMICSRHFPRSCHQGQPSRGPGVVADDQMDLAQGLLGWLGWLGWGWLARVTGWHILCLQGCHVSLYRCTYYSTLVLRAPRFVPYLRYFQYSFLPIYTCNGSSGSVPHDLHWEQSHWPCRKNHPLRNSHADSPRALSQGALQPSTPAALGEDGMPSTYLHLSAQCSACVYVHTYCVRTYICNRSAVCVPVSRSHRRGRPVETHSIHSMSVCLGDIHPLSWSWSWF